MGNEASKPPIENHEEIATTPSDAAPKRVSEAIHSFAPAITSRALLLQHLTTWIQCENDPSKQEIAEKIEQQWQNEYRKFRAPGAHSHLTPDGVALLVALYFPFNTSRSAKFDALKDAPALSNVHNDEISHAQAQWNLDAAEWINSERNGKQKSQGIRTWERTQQQEFQSWADPSKDSFLEADQVVFLQAIDFPLNAGVIRDDKKTASSVRTNKKRPGRKLTGGSTSKKAKKDSVSSRARAKAPKTSSRKTAYPSSDSWSHSLAMETDKDNLSENSCFAREQLELFCLTQEEVSRIRKTNVKKYKNKGSCLVKGQVGLRCKHCHLKTSFPGDLSGINIHTTNMVAFHVLKECKEISNEDRTRLIELRRSFPPGYHQKKGQYTGPEYMTMCLQDLGIHEVPGKKGLFRHHESDLS